ncbi:tyrosine-type recombinase/integrase [Candidatus Poribacteria bacterium]|nr:tyrosine-type recombinase/integrase [Candidatus Poribacteria bacterium]
MRKQRNSSKILTPNEEKRLLDWTHQNRSFRDYLAILTLLRTGLRATELRQLLVSDINAGGGIVGDLEVRPEIAHNQQPRAIPLSDDLREQLETFLEWKQQQGESIKPTSFLFASAKSPQITLRHLQRIVRESTVGALGVPYCASDLQRTYQACRKEETETTFSNATTPGVEILPPKRGVWRTYDVTDGLPSGAGKLLQDAKGYLWITTRVGVCRYDGVEFMTYTTEDGLGDNYIWTLDEDSLGRL